MGLEIYKNLPNNQAFVGIEHLQHLDEENRIAVVHFPYSDPETIPTILPLHLRNAPWNLPKDMNAFLCQLLEVRKRELFSFIPIPIVRPKVCTHRFFTYLVCQRENMICNFFFRFCLMIWFITKEVRNYCQIWIH